MKILHWTELFWPHIGGVETFTAQLLKRQQQVGHEVSIVTSHSGVRLPDEDQHDGIPSRRFPFNAILADCDLPRIAVVRGKVAALKNRLTPDVIHVHSSPVARRCRRLERHCHGWVACRKSTSTSFPSSYGCIPLSRCLDARSNGTGCRTRSTSGGFTAGSPSAGNAACRDGSSS